MMKHDPQEAVMVKVLNMETKKIRHQSFKRVNLMNKYVTFRTVSGENEVGKIVAFDPDGNMCIETRPGVEPVLANNIVLVLEKYRVPSDTKRE